jgi:hypothetical protein
LLTQPSKKSMAVVEEAAAMVVVAAVVMAVAAVDAAATAAVVVDVAAAVVDAAEIAAATAVAATNAGNLSRFCITNLMAGTVVSKQPSRFFIAEPESLTGRWFPASSQTAKTSRI